MQVGSELSVETAVGSRKWWVRPSREQRREWWVCSWGHHEHIQPGWELGKGVSVCSASHSTESMEIIRLITICKHPGILVIVHVTFSLHLPLSNLQWFQSWRSKFRRTKSIIKYTQGFSVDSSRKQTNKQKMSVDNTFFLMIWLLVSLVFLTWRGLLKQHK